MVDELRLRPVHEEDEAACLYAHNLMRHENFPFLLGYEPPESWGDYVRKLNERAHGRNLAPGWVPSTFFLPSFGTALSAAHRFVTPSTNTSRLRVDTLATAYFPRFGDEVSQRRFFDRVSGSRVWKASIEHWLPAMSTISHPLESSRSAAAFSSRK
jgi:hypothetical protein